MQKTTTAIQEILFLLANNLAEKDGTTGDLLDHYSGTTLPQLTSGEEGAEEALLRNICATGDRVFLPETTPEGDDNADAAAQNALRAALALYAIDTPRQVKPVSAETRELVTLARFTTALAWTAYQEEIKR
jgi:hypothetical protein